MVAVGMNGEPLPVVHGFPARLVVPGLYGYVSATKWLSEIELTTWDGFDGYWIPRGWSKEGPIKTQSRIDVPRGGASLTAGPQRHRRRRLGADPGHRARSRSRSTTATGRRPASATRPPTSRGASGSSSGTPPAGDHEIRVRATDGTGEVQTDDIAPPAPDGASGWHTISVYVD